MMSAPVFPAPYIHTRTRTHTPLPCSTGCGHQMGWLWGMNRAAVGAAGPGKWGTGPQRRCAELGPGATCRAEAQARLLRVSCCKAEPILLPSGAARLATASQEAGGKDASPREVQRLCEIWPCPGVTREEQFPVERVWPGPAKEQVVGAQEQTPGWVRGWGEVLLSPSRFSICCSTRPPWMPGTLRGGNHEP